MRILVTGGAGFIGSNFVRRMLSGEYPGLGVREVVVLDKLTYAGNLSSLAPAMDDPRFEFVHGDVCDRELVERVSRDARIVVHCAAETHVDRSIADGTDFVGSNVVGTYTVLGAALATGVEKVVLVSTDEVYGSVSSGSSTEREKLEPNSPYAASKAASDHFARAFHQTYGLPVCVTRCSNNYGPYQFPEKLIPLFITRLMDGLPVPVYGDGRYVREWVHVDDHCRGIALVAERGAPGEVYNIGGDTEMSNLRMTETILSALGADWSSVEFVEDRKGHDRRYSLDSSKITGELGYRPRLSFEEGLAGTIRWYAQNRSWWEPLRKRVDLDILGEPARE
ncbi:dTDP-glucose 4,6-dehydratase [Nocardiopsis quinghaiensis]|uniref:dTDP-glucose 4,6-dehydratase n=1 Tax=Nocardiopsis quinghaiensis TaxID=464995 RepID=UPI00123BF7A2|nr:dTDP-glucose 4,6-dehydratase [Nocardiopsis quinghaiensis]